MSNATQSGAGTRPVTDGTVDNIGAGEAFSRESPNHAMPAPKERMSEKRADAESVAADDSAPLGLTETAEGTRPDGGEPPESNPGRS